MTKFTGHEALKEATTMWVKEKEKALEQYGPIADWDVSEVESFENLFQGGKDFNEDLSKWKLDKCTSLYGTFYDCASFAPGETLAKWDTSKVTNFSYCFARCDKLDADLSSWDVSSAEDFNTCFGHNFEFNSDLSKWNTHKVTKMNCMFSNCTKFNADLSEWNVSQCKDMRFMFEDCKEFKCNLRKWDTRKAKEANNLEDMFKNATLMQQGHSTSKPKGSQGSSFCAIS